MPLPDREVATVAAEPGQRSRCPWAGCCSRATSRLSCRSQTAAKPAAVVATRYRPSGLAPNRLAAASSCQVAPTRWPLSTS